MCSPCLCTLSASASIYSAIPTFGRFLLKSFKFLVFAPFCYVVLPTHLQLMHHPSTCTDEWHPTANTLCPHDRKALEICHSYVQNKAQKHHPQRIPWLLVGFERNTYRVTVLGWLKKEDDEIFYRFRFATLK